MTKRLAARIASAVSGLVMTVALAQAQQALAPTPCCAGQSATAQISQGPPPTGGGFEFDRDTLVVKPPMSEEPSRGCEAATKNLSNGGYGLFEISAPCLARQQVKVVVRTPSAFAGALTFSARIGDDGTGLISFPLLDVATAVEFQYPDGKREIRTVVFADVRTTARIMLLWQGEPNLDLTVVEPGARLGDPVGVASAEKPSNESDPRTRGLIRRDDPGESESWHYEFYQVKAERVAAAKGRIFRWHVSRRPTASALAACNAHQVGATASPESTFLVATLSEGIWSGLDKRYRFDALGCGAGSNEWRQSVQGDARF